METGGGVGLGGEKRGGKGGEGRSQEDQKEIKLPDGQLTEHKQNVSLQTGNVQKFKPQDCVFHHNSNKTVTEKLFLYQYFILFL